MRYTALAPALLCAWTTLECGDFLSLIDIK